MTKTFDYRNGTKFVKNTNSFGQDFLVTYYGRMFKFRKLQNFRQLNNGIAFVKLGQNPEHLELFNQMGIYNSKTDANITSQSTGMGSNLGVC